jgi:hypothetical protein
MFVEMIVRYQCDYPNRPSSLIIGNSEFLLIPYGIIYSLYQIIIIDLHPGMEAGGRDPGLSDIS